MKRKWKTGADGVWYYLGTELGKRLTQKLGTDIRRDGDGRIHFKRRKLSGGSVLGQGFTIADVLTEMAKLRHTTPFTVLIISGHRSPLTSEQSSDGRDLVTKEAAPR